MKAKAWFQAQGQSAAARGLSLNQGRVSRYALPTFAQRAYAQGFISQTPKVTHDR